MVKVMAMATPTIPHLLRAMVTVMAPLKVMVMAAQRVTEMAALTTPLPLESDPLITGYL